MIALQVNNTFLDLAPDTSISITMLCPVFDPDNIERTFSYPFSLPATARNLNALEYANRLDTTALIKRDCNLFLNGVLFETGVLIIKKATKTSLRVVLQNTPLDIIKRLENVRLRSLTNTITVSDRFAPTYLICNNAVGATETHLAIIINDVLFTKDLREGDEIVDDINAVFPGMAAVVSADLINFNFQFSLDSSVVDELVVNLNPAISPSYLYSTFYPCGHTTETETQRINDDWDTYLASDPDEVKFPVINAPNIYAEKNAAFSTYVNYIDSSGAHPNDPVADVAEGWAHTLIPQPVLKEIFPAIAAQVTGLTAFAGTFLDDAEIQTLLIWSNRTLDLVPARREPYQDIEKLVYYHTYVTEFDVTDHLPDISAADLILYLINTFCLFLRYDRSRLYLTPRRELLNASPEDWTNKAEPEYDLDVEDIEGYSLDYNRQSDETTRAGQLERVDGGEEAVEFITPFYTLFEKDSTDLADTSRAWRLPYIYENGTVDFYDLETDPTIRLLFYRGQQTDSLGNNYPLATHGRYNYAGTEVGSYSLDWQGDGGLYDAWWKDYIKLVTTGRTVTVPIRLNIQDVLNLRKWTHIIKHIRFQHGQFVGVVKSVKFNATLRGISVATVEFLQKK